MFLVRKNEMASFPINGNLKKCIIRLRYNSLQLLLIKDIEMFALSAFEFYELPILHSLLRHFFFRLFGVNILASIIKRMFLTIFKKSCVN